MDKDTAWMTWWKCENWRGRSKDEEYKLFEYWWNTVLKQTNYDKEKRQKGKG